MVLNFNIKTRLMLLIVFFSASFFIFATFMRFEVINFSEEAELRKSRYEQIITAKEILQINTEITLIAMDSIVDKGERKISDERMQEFNRLFNEFDKIKQKFLDGADTPMEKTNSKAIIKSIETLKPIMKTKLKNLIEQGADDDKFAALDDEIDSVAGNVGNQIQAVIESVGQELKEAEEIIVEETNFIKTQITIAVVITIFLTLLLSYIVYRTIANSINKILAVAKDLAEGEGDLTKRINLTTKDEMKQIADLINTFIQKVQTSIHSVKSSSSETASISNELSSTTLEVGKRVEDSSALVNETTQMSEQIQEEIKDSVIEAQESKQEINKANKELNIAKKEIENLSNKVSSSVEIEMELASRIQQLSQDAEQVKDVLNVISDIADQTNLLALNAAIEAARAGEHGRGFAVVADEVRQLAERTQKSLTEINATINVIVQAISDTSEQMNHNSEEIQALTRIADDVQNKIDSTSEVMQKATQMSDKTVNDYTTTGEKIGKIVEKIDSVNKITESNARSIEEIASASEHLNSEAGNLNSTLEQFKT